MMVIRISKYDRWSADYIIQADSLEAAKEKAFQAAKEEFSCILPDTKEEMLDEIEIISTDAKIILDNNINI